MSDGELPSILTAWNTRIRAFFARRCNDRDDIDDLAQETMASIIRCYPAFSRRSTVSTWIYAVCRNVFSNYVYYRQRDRRLVDRLSLPPPVEDADLPRALREVLGRLPGDRKRLYVLFYVEGLSIREIAARLGKPEGTVKYLLHGLRVHLRRLLER